MQRALRHICVAIGLSLCLIVTQPVHAQDSRNHKAAAWTGIMTDTPIHGPWSLFVDTHYNTRAFVVLRGGVSWHSAAGPTLTGGYAHLWTATGSGALTRDEHRPWAQAFLPFRFADDWTLSQRLRAELRFQRQLQAGVEADGYWLTPRFRSQSAVSYWFASAWGLKFFAQTALELFANAGPNAGPNFLDQSRWSLMLGYKREPFTVRVGYMDRFVPGKNGALLLHEHDVIFWINFKTPGRHVPAVEVPEGGNP